MNDRRFKDRDWALPVNVSGNIETWDAVKLALLMDIRDELRTLTGIFRCPNFLAIPKTLHAIKRNTSKKRKVRK